MNTLKIFLIYKITNTINGKIYIGVTCQSLNARWSKHVSNALNNAIGTCRYLEASIRKYGKDNFKIEVLEKHNDENIAKNREIFWIKELNSYNNKIGMNLTYGGDGTSGHVVSEEQRKAISKARRGHVMPAWHRKIISKTHKGKSKSEEHKRKISEAQRGSKNHMFGKQLTDKHKQAVRRAQLGKIVSKKTREKKRQKAYQNGSDIYRTQAKLDKDKVLEIREKHMLGISQVNLARQYKVSVDTIYAVIHRRTWRDV